GGEYHRMAMRLAASAMSGLVCLVCRLAVVLYARALMAAAFCALAFATVQAQPLALKPDSLQVSAGVPGFWDPRRRPERPDLSHISMIRFLTETDYPPFDFASGDGNPAGFNVDLARMICEALEVHCTIQMRRCDT